MYTLVSIVEIAFIYLIFSTQLYYDFMGSNSWGC